MISLLLILIAAGLGAVCLKHTIEEVLPIAVSLLMLLLYGISILGYAARMELLVNAVFVVLILGMGLFLFKKNISIRDCIGVYACPGLWIYIILAAAMFFLFRTHVVTNWDDLNYWAMFPRNMYEINGLPTGSSSCTLFKDYSPIVQLLYFYGFQLLGHFSESLMFAVNSILIYTFLMPFFSRMKGQKQMVCMTVITGVILPYTAMFQQLHCLGVDCIMGVLFGYLVYGILQNKNRDCFYYVRIIALSSVFILMKSAAVLFVVITLVVLLVSWEKLSVKKVVISVLLYIPSFAGYFSWNLFCRLRGNYSYLTQRVSDNAQNPGAMKLPEYTMSTLEKFVEAFLKLPLNNGPLGFSPFIILLLAGCTFFLLKRVRAVSKQMVKASVVLAVGLVIYCISLLYIYLFVFDPWEADSLSSFDRYVGIYIVGILYLSLLALARRVTVREYAPVLVIMLVTLNFGFLKENFIAQEYVLSHQETITERDKIEAQYQKLKEDNPDLQGRRILLWSEEEDQGYNKYAQYAMVPNVTEVYSGDEEGAFEKAADRNMDYIYHIDTNSLQKVK